MTTRPSHQSNLTPGDALFCLNGSAQCFLWPEVGPVTGRVYLVECRGPNDTLKLEEPLGLDSPSLFSSLLPGWWFRKATAEEIAAERRLKAWETDQLMLTAMKQALDSGQPMTGDLRHWWVNRY